MKSIALLGFALAMSPGLVSAQQSPPSDAAASQLPHPTVAAMEQMHAQFEQIEKRSRAQILGALTPAHRTLLANVVGQLAIAPNPDRNAAARTLDSALSPGEASAILSAETTAREQARSLMEASRAQFEASLTPAQRTEMQQRMATRAAEHPANAMQPKRTMDPGKTLLHLAMGMGEEHRGFGHGGPPPMGARPPQ